MIRSLFLFILTFSLYAHDGDWTELNLKTFNYCFDFKKFNVPGEVNPALLSTVCFFLISTNRQYIHHSDYRPLRSEHHFGNALDFRVHSYIGMTKREKLIQYKKDLADFQEFLETLGLTKKVGLGIYPQSNNPFFHLDLRGEKGRWAEIDEQYVAWAIGIQWLEKLIAEDIYLSFLKNGRI